MVPIFPEVAYLGNAQSLTLSGLQTPNPRVIALLQKGELLKSMFLFFDGLMVFGAGPSKQDSGGISLQPQRSLHQLGDEHLVMDVSIKLDELTSQLIDMNLLWCADPGGLLSSSDMEILIEALIEGGVKASSKSRPGDMVPFDPGPLGIIMNDEHVRWVVEELSRLGRAEIRKSNGLVTLTDKGERQVSIGSEIVLVDRELSDFFNLMSDQLVRTTAWESQFVCNPLRASGHRFALPESLGLVDLANVESMSAGVDLSGASLADIQDFRRANDDLRRSYISELRRQAGYLATLDPPAAAVAVNEIQQDIEEASNEFTRSARDHFGPGPIGVFLGIVGSAVSVIGGNAAGGAVGLAAAFNAARKRDGGPAAYSYLFEARRNL